MRSLALWAAAAIALSGCNAELVGDFRNPGQRADGGSGPGPGPGGGDGGGGGMSCAPGHHLDGQLCVPDEVACAFEFPCPNGEQCIGGRCVQKPGPCAHNDQCPAGHVCLNGTCTPLCADQNAQCKADADCGPDSLCVACRCVGLDQCTKPTADLSGAPWQAHQVLHLDEALGAFGKIMVGILKDLRDGILGCPKGAGANCFLYQIIAQFLPNWAKTLIVAFANFGDIIDNHNFLVDSEMTFMKNGKPSGYSGVDHWLMLTFNYQNKVVMQKPENVPQIGKPVFSPFQASAVCGILYVDKHKIEGVLSGILRWILDTVVEISTNGQYKSLSDAIDGAVDCNSILDLAAKATCITFKKGLKAEIDKAIDAWLLDYSLMTLKGTAKVDPGGKLLTDGKWDGTIGNGIGIFDNFTGEWSAKR